MIEITRQTIHFAIETTGRQGSLALMRGPKPIRCLQLNSTFRTAATLAPEVDKTFRWCRENRAMPEFLTVANGPGSFTGLRIGVTTAKSLSYALNLPLIAVDSLASVAATVMHESPTVDSISVSLNAYRNQVYTGFFERKTLLPDFDAVPQNWSTYPPSTQILQNEAWETRRQTFPTEVSFAGDPKTLGNLADRAQRRECDAIGAALLGLRGARSNQWVDPLQLTPRYLKPSAAEENLA